MRNEPSAYHVSVKPLMGRMRPRRRPADQPRVDDALIASDALPYRSEGGEVGVLLCHGFTGSPRSLRAWAEHLAEAGYSVSLPRLPGHGTSWQDLNETTWTDWYAEVDRSLTGLRERCSTTFVFALSMGGALALRLAEQRPDDVAGLVLVNPSVATADPAYTYALPWLRWIVRSVKPIASDIAKPGIDEGGYPRSPLHAAYSLTRLWADVRANLSSVTAPLLLFASDVDHVVDHTSAPLILRQVRSSILLRRRLRRSWHVATMDWDAEEIFTSSVAFVERVLTTGRPAPSTETSASSP